MSSLSLPQTQTTVSWKLLRWVVLSLGIHALLLLTFVEHSTTSFHSPAEQAFNITLRETKTTPPVSPPQPPNKKPSTPLPKKSVHKPVPPKEAPQPPTPMKTVAKKAVSTPEPKPVSQVVSSTPTAITSPPAPSISHAQRDTFLWQIKTALARHFQYPRLAQRKGWQGEVTLVFTLERDGQIMNARIANSSGYSMLDRAALASLNKVGRITSLPTQALTLQLPVIYRLQEG